MPSVPDLVNFLSVFLYNIQDGGLGTFRHNLCVTLKSNLLLKIIKCGTASMLHKHTHSFYVYKRKNYRIFAQPFILYYEPVEIFDKPSGFKKIKCYFAWFRPMI